MLFSTEKSFRPECGLKHNFEIFLVIKKYLAVTAVAQAEFSMRADTVNKGILFTYPQKITLKNGTKKKKYR